MIGQSHSARYVWYVILLLFVVNVFNYMDRMALALLAPLIKIDLRLSDAHMGLLIGFAFSLFYAICGIPIARWADRGSRRTIITMALAVWSVMTVVSGAAQNLWQLAIARVGVGAGEAGGLPASQSIICDYVPPHRRPAVFAIHSFGLLVGMMLGLALTGWLAEVIGWRWTFVVIGLPGMGLALLVRLTLREPIRGQFDTKRTVLAGSFGQTIAHLWRYNIYRMLVLFLALQAFAEYGLVQWWPSFYARVFGLSLAHVGAYLGSAIGAGSMIGLLVGGFAANRISSHDARLPLMLGAVTTGLSLLTALASLFVSSTLGSTLLVGLTIMFWSIPMAPVLATLYSVVASDTRATAGALSMVTTSVLGVGLGPYCVGLLSDVLTPWLGVEALRYALLAPVLMIPVATIMLVAAAKVLPSDLNLESAEIERDRSSAGNSTAAGVSETLLVAANRTSAD